MVKVLGIVILMVALASGAHAGILDLYGEENTGVAGAQFLKVPVGARPVGLGLAYTACALDGPVVFWNPAGLMRTPGLKNGFASHTEWAAGIDIDHAAFQWRTQSFGFGVSAGMLRSGEIPRTTETHAEGTGETFSADQYVLGFSVARAMTDRFSIGGTAKFFQENLDEWYTRAVLFDLGILYLVGVGDLRVGFAVRNFGADLKPSGDPPALGNGSTLAQFQEYPAPTEGSFGLAYTYRADEQVSFLQTADFYHPSDARENFRFGNEIALMNKLFLRFGYETSRDEGGIGAGFGLQLKRKQKLLRIDYGYRDMGAFGGMHFVSFEASPLWAKERTRHGRAGR